jgi:hypothetical protein
MEATMAELQKLELFLKALKKQRKIMIIVGVCIGIFGLFMAFIPANTDKDLYFKIGLVGFFQAVAALLIWASRKPAENHDFIMALLHRPEKVVWAYVQHNRQNGSHVASLMVLKFNNGKTAQAPFPQDKELDAKNIVLSILSNDVAYGYSGELLQIYKKDPANFISNLDNNDS